jgi:hypothetical protein
MGRVFPPDPAKKEENDPEVQAGLPRHQRPSMQKTVVFDGSIVTANPRFAGQ